MAVEKQNRREVAGSFRGGRGRARRLSRTTAAARPLISGSERSVPRPMLRLRRSPKKLPARVRGGILSEVEGSVGEKEEKGILRFIQEGLEYFGELFEAGIEMDLVKVVGKPGELDETRFRVHVSPSKAATGLRYSNLMRELLCLVKGYFAAGWRLVAESSSCRSRCLY